ncbi:MAG TPA: HIT domain-containing protein [Streptosporangiaceae bacterium]|nr:HIT domain-containing protein [Streptosporangiaceae bacterium]
MSDQHPSACDDSQLCQELAGRQDGIAFHEIYRGEPSSRVILESINFALVADISPLALGHTLLVPKRHYISFGKIPVSLHPELTVFRDKCISLVAQRYGQPTILEHGSCSSMMNSPCISHAHWQIIPNCKSAARIFETDGLSGRDIFTWQGLKESGDRDLPYLYYSHGDVHRLYVENLSKRHQYIRVVLAEVLGIPEPEWDWGLSLRPDLLRQTVYSLSGTGL